LKDTNLRNYKEDKFYPKVVKAVGLLLQDKNEISTVDILLKMGKLLPRDYENWRRGKTPYLEKEFRGNLSTAGRILRIINFHMHDLNMIKYGKPMKTLNDNQVLQYSKSGIKKIEEVYSRCFKWNRSEEVKKEVIERSLFFISR
jgi:hypothetical protein